ncbi:MAG: sugar ABC transporter permease [Lentisphaerae bacterium]|nr:sugar ABC transporter permease [Lentisphaerota bacterium]
MAETAVRKGKWLPPKAVFGFLLPNFLGFFCFTLFPVLFSLFMVFTNWTLKPAVAFEVVGLRNLNDLLGVRPLGDGSVVVCAAYVVCALLLVASLVGSLWSHVVGWKGSRVGSAIMGCTGVALVVGGLVTGAHHSVFLVGLVLTLSGAAGAFRDEGEFRLGRGVVPAAVFAVALIGIVTLNGSMWQAYEPRDARFWQYFFNTVYLMLAIPVGIASSLGLAILLSDELPRGPARVRIVSALLCLVAGVATFLILLGLGHGNLAFLGGLFWFIALLGCAFGVVSHRTVYYLPHFTSGVALMILWKALYNPKTGPINAMLNRLLETLGMPGEAPTWLTDYIWAKPALMFMGVWTAAGGTNMLLYLAALSNVPKDLLDAAEVDGAGRWSRFRHVTWPQLAPTTFFISIMAVIGGLQGGFEMARVMTGGGPAGATTTLSYYIFMKGFEDLNLGYAAAISWVLFSVIFVATAINWRFGKELEVEP